MKNKKSLLRFLKRIKGRGKKKKNKERDFKGHDKYYQTLYNNFYSDHAKEMIGIRDKQIDSIKEEIGKLNNNDLKGQHSDDYLNLNAQMKYLQRQNVIDSELASSLKIGNNISHPLARDLREQDDQRIFGDNIYANMHRPNYNEIANQSRAAKTKLAQYMSDPVNQMKMAQLQQMV